jgi:hypothetical protein
MKMQVSRTPMMIALGIIAAGVYVASLGHLFVIDDHDLLERVIAAMQSPLDAWRTTGAFQAYYRPVFLTHLYLDNLVWGGAAWGFHLSNILLHGITAMLAFLFAERLLRNRWSAAIVALLFALHPSHTENVSWVSGRTDVISALFSLIALNALYDVRLKGSTRAGVIAAAAYALAIMSKEVAVMVPVVGLVMLALWHRLPGIAADAAPAPATPSKGRRRELNAKEREALQREAGAHRWRLVRLYGIFAAITVIALMLRNAAVGSGITENTFLTTERTWLHALRAFAMYVWHGVAGGGYDYLVSGWRVSDPAFNLDLPELTEDWVRIGTTIALFLSIVVLAIWRRRPLAIIALAGFVLFLIPALGFVPLVSFFAVRFLYIPSFFLGLLIVDAANAIQERWALPSVRIALAGAAAAVIVWFGVSTVMQNANWHDDVTLMDSMPTQRFRPVYRFVMGNGYRYRGDIAIAAMWFDRAVSSWPGYREAYANLAACYIVLGQRDREYLDKAVETYSNAIRDVHDGMFFELQADLHMKMGNVKAALQAYHGAYMVHPTPLLKQRLRDLGVELQ